MSTYTKSKEQAVIFSGGGKRFSVGKAPLILVPKVLDEAAAYVFLMNSTGMGGKYDLHNWRKGLPHSSPLDSLLRHAKARADGEILDPDDALPHTWHMACNIAMLLQYEKMYPEMNDLYTPQAEIEAAQELLKTSRLKEKLPNVADLITGRYATGGSEDEK